MFPIIHKLLIGQEISQTLDKRSHLLVFGNQKQAISKGIFGIYLQLSEVTVDKIDKLVLSSRLAWSTELQDSQGYTEKSCLQKTKNKTKKDKIGIPSGFQTNVSAYVKASNLLLIDHVKILFLLWHLM